MGDDWIYDVIETTDGGFLGVGFSDIIPEKHIPSYIKIDANGDYVWDQIVDLGQATLGGTFKNVKVLDNGNFVMFGHKGVDIPSQPNLKTKLMLNVIDPSGNTLPGFPKQLLPDVDEEIRDALGSSLQFERNAQGVHIGYTLTGTIRQIPFVQAFGYIMKIDLNGNPMGFGTKVILDDPNNFSEIKNHRNTYDASGIHDGYILTGSHWTGANPESDVYLVKLNLNGDVVWEKKYSKTSLLSTGQYTDNFDYNNHTTELETGEQGYVQCFRNVDGVSIPIPFKNNDERGFDVVQDPNGNFILNAFFDHYKCSSVPDSDSSVYGESSYIANDAFLINVNPDNGNVNWTNNYRFFAGVDYHSRMKILENPDSPSDFNIVTIGNNPHIDANGIPDRIDAELLMMNSQGERLWVKKFNDGSDEYCMFGLALTSDGGYMVAGNNEMDIEFEGVEDETENYIAMKLHADCTPNDPGPLVITDDTDWDTDRDVCTDVVINNGVDLTITATINMADGKHITVKPGARLFIDGATLTNNDGELWNGIYVEGNSNQTQSVSKQGYLKIRNGSIIKNAYQGVVNYGLKTNGDTDWNKTGGIIKAYNSTFLNNRWDVSFLKYQQFYGSGAPRPDKSEFFGCSFIDDDNFVSGSSPARAIGMYGVHNVKIKGCTFSDNRDVTYGQKGVGIVSEGAYYNINIYSEQPTTFNGLKNAIQSYDYDAASIIIKNADFNNCFNAVYLNGINDAEVNFNHFIVPVSGNTGGESKASYGLYLDMCHNYEVEENSFNSELNPELKGGAFGVLVNNRHGEVSEIRNNTFDNFYVATEAIGQNKDIDPDEYKGLEFRCNNYSNNKYDVFVTPDYNNPGPVVGIAYHQGELLQNNSDLAGNLFGNDSPVLESNYKNKGDKLYYIHHNESSNSRVVPVKYSNISPIESPDFNYNPALSCPPQSTGGGGGDEIMAALYSAIESSGNEVIQIDNQLATLVDGGNTEALENDVILTDNADAWKKYQELMANAGYLSDEVLDEVSKKETGFNKAMIRNVLVANPQAAKSEKVQENLDNRGDQLPDYMRDQIDMGLTKMSSKEYLELVKATHQTRHDAAIDQLVGLLKSDTLNDRSAEIVNALSNTGKVAFDYKLVAYYDAHNQSNLADVLLEVIDGYNLSDNQQQYFDNYNAFRNLTAQWNQAEVNMAELDSAKLQELKVFSELNNSVTAKAIALQHLNRNFSYIEPIYDPEGGDKSNTASRRKRTVVNDNKMLLFPNPADGYFTVEYNLIDPFNKAVLVVFDMNGRMVLQNEINYSIDQIIIPSDNWPSGQYTCTLFADGKTIMTKQITITK